MGVWVVASDTERSGREGTPEDVLEACCRCLRPFEQIVLVLEVWRALERHFYSYRAHQQSQPGGTGLGCCRFTGPLGSPSGQAKWWSLKHAQLIC